MINLKQVSTCVGKDKNHIKTVSDCVSQCAKNNETHIASKITPKTSEIPISYKFSYIPKPSVKNEWESLVPDIENYLNPENFIGSGGEADVYGLGENYVLRFFGGKHSDIVKSDFKAVPDIFEDKNFGQAVATNSERVSINKKVKGVCLYKVNNFNEQEYMQRLREYSELPDKTLDEFVSDIAYINSKGYRIDQSNPENFLYDKANGKIGIIDLCRKGSSSLDLYEPYGHDWVLDPLVNGHDFMEIYEKASVSTRKEMMAHLTKLENRILPMCEKHNIPKSKWSEEDYMPSSLMNILEVKNNIDYSKDLFGQIIYEKYPKWIPKYERYMENKQK